MERFKKKYGISLLSDKVLYCNLDFNQFSLWLIVPFWLTWMHGHIPAEVVVLTNKSSSSFCIFVRVSHWSSSPFPYTTFPIAPNKHLLQSTNFISLALVWGSALTVAFLSCAPFELLQCWLSLTLFYLHVLSLLWLSWTEGILQKKKTEWDAAEPLLTNACFKMNGKLHLVYLDLLCTRRDILFLPVPFEEKKNIEFF